jgi:hypothetical protein
MQGVGAHKSRGNKIYWGTQVGGRVEGVGGRVTA